jgi:CheY-like chemotaxis protein
MNSEQSVSVLVIDDDPDQYGLIKAILELEGYTVLTAENAEMGLELYKRHHPFIVITDFSMPDLDGAEFVKRIRTTSADGLGLAPIILVSAYSADYINKYVNKSFPPDLILPKPVDFDQLLAVVKTYYQRYRRLNHSCAA